MLLSKLSIRDRQTLKTATLTGQMVHIHYIRYSTPPMDEDNLHGSFKLMGDALKDLELIKNDSKKYITLRCSQVGTKHSQTKLIITL